MTIVSRSLVLSAVAVAILAPRAGAATDPGLPGPFAAGVRTADITVAGGDTLTTDIHFPSAGSVVDPAAGRCPLLVFGHGFSSVRDFYVGHGQHWATRGCITFIPNMVGGSDHSHNADDLVGLITWALDQDLDPSSFLYGRIDRDAIGSTGHSAGGLSSLVATARDPRVKAAAPFDPVDNGGLGVGAMPSITVPVSVAYSEDSACNANGSARTLYAAASPVNRAIKIVGGTHCDPLDPLNVGCDLFCGGSSAAAQALYRRHVTAWFEFWLHCDASYFEWVYGARVQDDVSAGLITYQADPDSGPVDPCVAPGTPPGPVTGLRARRSGVDVIFRWDPVVATPAVSEYRVYRADVVPFVFAPPRVVSVPETATDTGAVDGIPLYFYLVRAWNSAGEGP